MIILENGHADLTKFHVRDFCRN